MTRYRIAQHSVAQRRRQLPGQFIGCVTEYTPQGNPLSEIHYYYRAGTASAYLGSMQHGHIWRQWPVAGVAQLREWVSLEQVATGLRRAVLRQVPPAGRASLPEPLVRLRALARAAREQADAAAASPRRLPQEVYF